MEEKKKFKESFDTIFTDCDGVLYNLKGVINNAPETINELINEGKTIRYVTSNVTKTRTQMVERLTKLGFVNVTEESVINPLGLIADYLRDKLPQGQSVYAIGPQGKCDELLRYKIPCFGPGKDEMDDKMIENVFRANSYELPENVGAVVVGPDFRVSYLKILKAMNFFAEKGLLIRCHQPGRGVRWESGLLIPGTAPISASITVASGRTPLHLGKPSRHLIQLLKTMAKDPERTLFVGDSLEADILTGHKCSFKTVLALTGNHNLDDVKRYAPSNGVKKQMYIPDFYVNTLSDLV